MHLELPREKERVWLLSIIYRVNLLLAKVLPPQGLLKLLLDLEWIFCRLATEQSGQLYSRESHPSKIESYPFILEEIHPEETVLDLGSFLGHMSWAISLKAKEVVGVEIVSERFEAATRLFKRDNLSFVNEDIIDYLAHTDRVFDVIIISHVLEHLCNPLEFLRSISKSFKRVYIEVPDFDATPLNLMRLDAGSKLIYTDADHVFEFDRRELRKLIGMAGLDIEKESFSFGVIRVWCKFIH